MARNIDEDSQLNLFSTIKDSLLGSTLISNKFDKSDFYEFEPNLKSINFGQVPYISIKVPVTDTAFLSLNHSITEKDFDIPIILVMGYSAKDNFKVYAQEIIRQMEKEESTFGDKGYEDLKIDLISAEPEIADRNQVIVGLFRLSFNGGVCR